MARRKKKPIVVEENGAVVVKYVGMRLPPERRPEKKRRHCPQCGWGPASTHTDRYSSQAYGYGFECRKCCDPETGRPFRWTEAIG